MSVHKATAIAPANIAFIKYWGVSNKKLIIPANDSISMNLSNCVTTTTVEFSPLFEKDSVKIKFFEDAENIQNIKAQEISGKPLEKVMALITRVRNIKQIDWPVKIVSHNSFPANAGIASSASGFAALTLAASSALGLGWEHNKKKLSIETRLSGSGSACRSIVGGFAYWQQGQDSDNSYAYQLHDINYWNLVDLVVVVSCESKEISSKEGHVLAHTSPYYQARLQELPQRICAIKEAMKQKDFQTFGELLEQEAISLHTICMTSRPPIFYINNKTFEIIEAVRSWRKEGLLGYFTIDAGPNLHIICQKKDAKKLQSKLQNLPSTLFTIVNTPCQGAKISDKHLF